MDDTIDVLEHQHCALLARLDAMAEQLRYLQNAAGAVPGPMDCWLALRGTKTLAVRMKRHDENARVLARTLATHAGVRSVHYPGLETHPQHALAKRQASGFGGIQATDRSRRDAGSSIVSSSSRAPRVSGEWRVWCVTLLR